MGRIAHAAIRLVWGERSIWTNPHGAKCLVRGETSTGRTVNGAKSLQTFLDMVHILINWENILHIMMLVRVVLTRLHFHQQVAQLPQRDRASP